MCLALFGNIEAFPFENHGFLESGHELLGVVDKVDDLGLDNPSDIANTF
jgi:hypothetical protein